jgi:serine/threonine-protein kinase HipA
MGDNLFPFFAGLLPEGRRFNALVRQLKTSQDDLFSIFALVGAHCVGDINTVEKYFSLKESPKLKEVNFYQLFEQTVDPKGLRIRT